MHTYIILDDFSHSEPRQRYNSAIVNPFSEFWGDLDLASQPTFVRSIIYGIAEHILLFVGWWRNGRSSGLGRKI